MSATLLPKTRLPLSRSPDGLAYFVAAEVDSASRALLLDTSSLAGVSLACPSLAPSGTNATACLAKASRYSSCPANSTYTSFWGTSMCLATARRSVKLTLGDLNLPAVPAIVLTGDTSLVLHGADGILGLAKQSVYTTRVKNLTDQIQSFSLNLVAKEPYLLINDVDSEISSTNGWTPLRQKSVYTNGSTVAVRGFTEGVDDTFVTAKSTQISYNTSAYVDGWLDAAWPSIVFPKIQFNAFHSKYLTACVPHNESSKNEVPRFYHCDRSVTLPRLAFTTTNGTFFLDRADYVTNDPSDAARALVLVQNYSSSRYSSIAWGLGQPFLRKFPAFFNGSGKEHQITLFCKSSVSCDLSKWVVNGSPAYYDDYEDASGSTGRGFDHGSGGSTRSSTVTIRTHRPSEGSSSETKNRLWTLGIIIPFAILCTFIGGRRIYRQQKVERERRRRMNEASATDAALPPHSEAKSGDPIAVSTPTAMPYSLLGGPSTLTVSTNPSGAAATTSVVPPPATGVAARWRNDLADLETRL